jgi:hypothetical protein
VMQEQCSRCQKRNFPCSMGKWRACVQCHNSKVKCSIVLRESESMSFNSRGRSVKRKKLTATTPTAKQLRVRRTSRAADNKVAPEPSGSRCKLSCRQYQCMADIHSGTIYISSSCGRFACLCKPPRA